MCPYDILEIKTTEADSKQSESTIEGKRKPSDLSDSDSVELSIAIATPITSVLRTDFSSKRPV